MIDLDGFNGLQRARRVDGRLRMMIVRYSADFEVYMSRLDGMKKLTKRGAGLHYQEGGEEGVKDRLPS